MFSKSRMHDANFPRNEITKETKRSFQFRFVQYFEIGQATPAEIGNYSMKLVNNKTNDAIN